MNQHKPIAGLGLATFVILALGGPPLEAQKRAGDDAAAVETFGETTRDPMRAAKPERTTRARQSGLAGESVPEVVLPAVDTAALLAEDQLRYASSETKVLRYSVGRDLSVRAEQGFWYALPGGGHLWMVDVVSPGALGLRLELTDLRLPAGSEIAVYGAKGGEVEFIDADLPELASRPDLWTGTVFGEQARVEYYTPSRHVPDRLPFAVTRIQHVYVDPVARLSDAAGACHNDVTCYSAWSSIANAVAGIGTIGTDGIWCSGQLLNNLSGDFTPYWLTANHCLSTATAAQNAEIYWFYQTSTCNGTPPTLSSVQRSRTATLLATGTSSDYTLLMIEGRLPWGLTWSGWTSASISDGTASTAIHHPAGDFKRISFGNKASNPTCGGSNHVRVNWTDGPTEPGSSGSGIFKNDTQQLYGQLHCGPSACGNETNDSYGAFSSTYGNISSYMAGGSDDGSEQNDSCAAARSVSSGTLSGRIVKYADEDWYQVSVASGGTLTVTLSFTHANGDIDLALYSACGGSVLTGSYGVGNSESVSLTNNSGGTITYKWRVYLFSDTRNSYNMTTSVYYPPPPCNYNGICEAGEDLSCADCQYCNEGAPCTSHSDCGPYGYCDTGGPIPLLPIGTCICAF